MYERQVVVVRPLGGHASLPQRVRHRIATGTIHRRRRDFIVGECRLPTNPRYCFNNTGENQMRFDCLPRHCTMEYEIETDESTSTAVVCAVSAVEGRDRRSLRPLAEVLDPAAMNTLFGSRDDGTPRPGGRLTFVYSKCCVTVDNGEYLTLQPIGPRIRDERGPDVIDSGM